MSSTFAFRASTSAWGAAAAEEFQAGTLSERVASLPVVLGVPQAVRKRASASSKLIFLIPAVICSLPIYKKIFVKSDESSTVQNLELVWAFIVFSVSVCLLVASTYNPFIYFRF